MISGINAANTQPSFTSTMPVRVRIDGMETFDTKYIQSACRQLSNVLIGPTKEKDIARTGIIRAFGNIDPDYNILYGITGYPKPKNARKMQPSDYFRYIHNKACNIFVTGKQAEILRDLGHAIGLAKSVSRERNITNSFDIKDAEGRYFAAKEYFIRNRKIRLTENYDENTGIKFGRPVTLIIDMTSNGKYGLSTFKINLNRISFQPS